MVKSSHDAGSVTGRPSQPNGEFSRWSDTSMLSRLRQERKAAMPCTDLSLDEVSVFGRYVTLSSETIC